MDKPRVTIITPLSRNRDIGNAIANYERQTYPNKELTIFNDDGRTDYMDVEKRIWVWGRASCSIGFKRDELCRLSQGEIIIMFDSDDWYREDYIDICIQQLQSCDITGLSQAYFQKGDNLYKYTWRGGQPYVLGSGMAFHKHVWGRKRFEDRNDGEDLHFQSNNGLIVPHGQIDSFRAVIHDNNTSSHRILPYLELIL